MKISNCKKHFSLTVSFLSLIFCLVFISSTVHAQRNFNSPEPTQLDGGATSGGGEHDGIEVQRVFRMVVELIRQDKGLLYSAAERERLLTRAALIRKVLMVENIRVQTSAGEQESSGFSSYNPKEVDKSFLSIDPKRWQIIDLIWKKEGLVHHELAVLSGLEKTGEYKRTEAFESHRHKLWKTVQSKKFVCSMSLFSKKMDRDGAYPDELLGSTGVSVTDPFSVVSSTKIVKFLSLNGSDGEAVIFRYVSSGNGYLRGLFSVADISNYNKNPNFGITFKSKLDSKMEVYFSPYDLIDEGQEARLTEWTDYFTMVSCSKIP